MSNSGINRNIDTVISTLNDKADRELENSNRANNIERLADSSYELAAATSTLVEFTVNNVNSQLATKVSNKGDTINGNVIIDGNLTVTGDVNIPADGISGSVEVATKATQDSNGNVIVSTYATKAELANISGNPVGTIIAFASNTVPNGYLLCSGATVSRTTYSKLFEVIGTLYGAGDNSTTFTLPNMTSRFLEGQSAITSNNAYIAAGLPNITGSFYDYRGYIGQGSERHVSGAFIDSVGYAQGGANYTSNGVSSNISFDASDSNTIYGSSTTVQPLTISVRFFIKY